MPKIWMKDDTIEGEKFLVVRRDGTIPAWGHFVLGARDPLTSRTLRFYAGEARREGWDKDYVSSIEELANDFDKYREQEGVGDPPASPHRKDNPSIIDLMTRKKTEACVELFRDLINIPKE